MIPLAIPVHGTIMYDGTTMALSPQAGQEGPSRAPTAGDLLLVQGSHISAPSGVGISGVSRIYFQQNLRMWGRVDPAHFLYNPGCWSAHDTKLNFCLGSWEMPAWFSKPGRPTGFCFMWDAALN